MTTSDREPPPHPSEPASVYVRRAMSGDAEGLEETVKLLSPLLEIHAAYRLGPTLRRHHDPIDLVAEAWLVALPRLQELGAREGRKTPVLVKFLTTTVARRVQELARKHGRERPRDDAPVEPQRVSQVPDDISGVVTRTLRRERGDVLRACLAGLAEADREVLLLRGVEQLSNRAAASRLGIGEEAVSKRYRRALARLREALPRSVFDELVG